MVSRGPAASTALGALAAVLRCCGPAVAVDQQPDGHRCFEIEHDDGSVFWRKVHPFSGFPQGHKLMDNPACGNLPAVGDPIPHLAR